MANEHKHSPKQELLDALRTARDSAQVQLHLLSREARKRWHDLEDKLDGVEARLYQAGEAHAETGFEGATATVRELTQAVKDLVREGTAKATELIAPLRGMLQGPAVTCAPSDSLAQAARLLWEHDCGVLVVTDADNKALGMLTDRDICMAAFIRGMPLHAIDVASAMSQQVYSVDVNASLTELAHVLAQHQIRRAPVLEHGKVVGLVSLADLARLARRSPPVRLPLSLLLTQTLAEVSSPRHEPGLAQAAE
jgi:CBS domain-containing protein